MKKQKVLSKAALHMRTLHRRRTGWFAVLGAGLLLIQLAYNVHIGHPRVLGYSARIEQAQLLNQTNQYRTKAGYKELKLSPILRGAAEAKAADMVTKNYWDHVAPDGTTPWTYFEHAGYRYLAAGENLAYGFLSSEEVASAWMNSETHRTNMLGQYTEVGFGIVNAPNYQGGNNVVVVAFYGTPATAPAAQASTATLPVANDDTIQRVNGLAIVATGGANWAMYASFGLLGAAAMGFVMTHLELLRLGWYRSKRYLALHPIADAAVIVIIALVLVYAAGGFIL